MKQARGSTLGAISMILRKLVEWMGGPDMFYSRLDTMFEVGANPNNPSGIIFDSTNEP